MATIFYVRVKSAVNLDELDPRMGARRAHAAP